MAVTDWSTTASANTTIDGINIAEGCSPAGINNAIRSVMAATRDFYDNAALLNSPDLTGTPTAPTATVGDNDTSIATTAFVQAELMPTVQSVTSASSVTPNGNPSGDDAVVITALAANLTINAPSNTPVQMKPLIFRIKDNGTIRTLTWNAIYRAIGVTLPTATVASKTLYVGFLYNSTDSTWDCVMVRQQA